MATTKKQKEEQPQVVPDKVQPKKVKTETDFVPEEVHIKETIIRHDVKREEAIKILQEQYKKQKL